jgi:hypothetical protein
MEGEYFNSKGNYDFETIENEIERIENEIMEGKKLKKAGILLTGLAFLGIASAIYVANDSDFPTYYEIGVSMNGVITKGKYKGKDITSALYESVKSEVKNIFKVKDK